MSDSDFVANPVSGPDSGPDSTAPYELIQLSGPGLTLPANLDRDLLLGRGLDCDLVLTDPGVSRHHARIEATATPRVDDLGSAAGTYLNEQRIEGPTPFRPGDRLQIGPWTFRLRRCGLTAGEPTIRTAALANVLAAPRLERLMSFAEAINQADRPEDVLQALADAAHGVSGFDRALIIDPTVAADRPWLASPSTRSEDRPSRTLVEQARGGDVVELCEADVGDASESILALNIVSALAAGVRSADAVRYVLYLDRRSGEAEAHPDTPRFCESLARLAELGLARIEQTERLQRQRERIYADLHDDLGARLLNQVYRAPDPAARDEARAMLQDLRDVVSRPSSTPVGLDELLGEIRSEARERLETAGIALDWPPSTLPEIRWSPGAAALLSRSIRELISNVIRHARPDSLELRCRASKTRWVIELAHPANGADPADWVRGRGLHSLADRAERLGGQIEWRRDGALLKTRLELPLDPAPGR
jgi:signal transduction histidine kinase/pSer/pThr/pTyr-binding forkhead associated (FHA) protein